MYVEKIYISTYCVKVDVRIKFAAVRLFSALPYLLHERIQREVLRDVDYHGRDEAAEEQKERDNDQSHRID